MNVTELLTMIRKTTKQTKNTTIITDLRGGLKTADHCGAVWKAGGKPSTKFPPGRLVEQSGVKEQGIYKKRFEGNRTKKQREETAEIDKSKTRHHKLKLDGATPKRDGRM